MHDFIVLLVWAFPDGVVVQLQRLSLLLIGSNFPLITSEIPILSILHNFNFFILFYRIVSNYFAPFVISHFRIFRIVSVYSVLHIIDLTDLVHCGKLLEFVGCTKIVFLKLYRSEIIVNRWAFVKLLISLLDFHDILLVLCGWGYLFRGRNILGIV